MEIVWQLECWSGHLRTAEPCFLRITRESIMNLGKKTFGNDIDRNDILFIQVTINNNKGEVFHAHTFQRPDSP